MNPTLDTFHNILFGSLKPWVKNNHTNEQFKMWISEAEKLPLSHSEKYTLKFIKPFSPKTSYYATVITNSVSKYMNELKFQFLNVDSENIKTNLIHHALKKELSPILEKIATIIEQEDYKPDYIDIANLTKTDSEMKENTFIFHLLKAHTIRLYLEIEDFGKSYLKAEYLELKDIHYQYYNEAAPGFFSITNSENKIHKPVTAPISKSNKSPREYHSFTLKNLTREQYKLTYVCDSLKKNEFIQNDTTLPIFKKIFSGDYVETPVRWIGNKSELAYFIKQIHNKHKIVESLKQEHWKVAVKCFSKPDCSSFDYSEFRELKKPSQSEKLDMAIEHLK